MQDKIALLMEETGCDRGEAELALEMCGFELEEAVRALPRLLKNIAVVKARFVHADRDRFGLLLAVLNTKTGSVLRARAVVSFNPAVYAASLDKDWFEFEKFLYGCRLWDGSIQSESFEIERKVTTHFRDAAAIARLARQTGAEVTSEIAAVLQEVFRARPRQLQAVREILDLGQFHLRNEADAARRSQEHSRSRRDDDLLVLKVALDEAPDGVLPAELHAGDLVSALIVDQRDIAQYLAKLFGGYSDGEPVPVTAPVEAVESMPKGVLTRVRFSVGVAGDAVVPAEARLRVVRQPRQDEAPSWWQRFFRG
jgi:hypothetical protein